jgi:hypothetical protein
MAKAKRAKATLTLTVEFNPDETTAEALCGALDNILEVGLAPLREEFESDYGKTTIGYFGLAPERKGSHGKA